MNVRTTRIIAAGAAAGALVSLGVTSPIDAASAASYCFVYADGDEYSNAPTFLQVYSDGWRTIATGSTDANGCGSFNINDPNRDHEVRVVAQSHSYSHNGIRWIWRGTTPATGESGNGNADLGTGSVQSTPVIRRPLHR